MVVGARWTWKLKIQLVLALGVLTKSNKNRYDSYCLKAVPLFETVKGLKEYLVQRSGEELKPATTGEDFTLGYFGDGNSIFLRLTAELAGKYALIVIFVCLCVGMWGILAGVYILAVKEWVFHLGLAFRRSCFVFIVSYIFVAVCVFFFSSFSFF